MGRKLGTVGSRGDSTVACTPAVCRRSPLRLASVEDSDTAAGNLQVKVILAQIVSRVGDLHDHALAGDCSRGEGQLVARAAVVRLSLADDGGSSKAVGQAAVHHEGNVVVADVRGSSVAAGCRARGQDADSVLRAGLHGRSDGGLAVP